jgi:hypothetical protein
VDENELADDPAAEADGHRMGTGARLELGEKVPHVRFDRFLRQEEPLADLSVHEPVGDELQYLDLAHRRFLLELAQRAALQRNDVGAAGSAPTCSHFLEAARMRHITAEDLLALRSVHEPSIGAPHDPL